MNYVALGIAVLIVFLIGFVSPFIGTANYAMPCIKEESCVCPDETIGDDWNWDTTPVRCETCRLQWWFWCVME